MQAASGTGESLGARTDWSATPQRRVSALDWIPATLAAFGTVVAVGGNQGGYFPTSWGPSLLGLLALLAVCLGLGATTDAGRLDAAAVLALTVFISWIALSTVWSTNPTETINEVQRSLVVLAGFAAILLAARGGTQERVAFGVAQGIVGLCMYALATRVLPGQLGNFDSSEGYRLAAPIGYWNGLGILATLGILLLVGIALESRVGWERTIAAVSLCIVSPTLYFTFSRGAWVALFLGLAAMLTVSPHRLRTLAGLLFLSPAPVVVVIVASRLQGLTIVTAKLFDAHQDGRRLIAVLCACALLAVSGSLAWQVAERHISISQRVRLVIGAVAVAALCFGVVGGVIAKGGPTSLARQVTDSFDAPQGQGPGQDLNDRLFLLTGSGRGDLWRVALSTWQSSPLLGVGAGTYERYWQKSDRWSYIARDAHSLYLETLAELGPIGLLLLVVTLGIPLAALVVVRHQPTIAAAAGAYTAFMAHAAIDWDWELTGIALTALLIGSLGLISLRTQTPTRLRGSVRMVGAAAVAAVAGMAAVSYIGNDALDRAQSALDVGNTRVALSESRVGSRWGPWSPYPLTVRGEALLRLNRDESAREAFREALAHDSGYWRAWLGLAVASEGAEREAAMRRAEALYPRSKEIAQTKKLLAHSNRPTLVAKG